MLKHYVFLLSIVSGIGWQLQQPQLGVSFLSKQWWLVLGCSIIVLLLGRYLSSRLIVGLKIILLFTAAFTVGFVTAEYQALKVGRQLPAADILGKPLLLVGEVVNLPRPTELGWQFEFKLLEKQQLSDVAADKLPDKILLSWNASAAWRAKSMTPSVIEVGQRWVLPVSLRPVHGNFNQFGFDYELYMWRKKILTSGYVAATEIKSLTQAEFLSFLMPTQTDKKRVALHIKDAKPSAVSFIARLRQEIINKINRHIAQERSAGVVAALAVGAQSRIQTGDWQLFRLNGIIHLVSISGLHITMFAFLAAWVIKLVWRCWGALCLVVPAEKAALLGAVFAGGFYALLSGFAVPAQRAAIMLALAAGLRLTTKRWSVVFILLLTLTTVLLYDPWAFLQAGFWLSFIATAALFTLALDSKSAVLSSRNLALVPSEVPVSFLRQLPEKALTMLREQWLISLVLLPLTIWFFQMASWIGLAVNLIAIPLISLFVMPLCVMGVFWAPLWQLAVWLINQLYLVLELAARLPWAGSNFAKPPLVLMLLGLGGATVLLLPLARHWKLIGLSTLLPLFVWQQPTPSLNEFRVTFFDIGQGAAAIIQTATKTLIYDAGPPYSDQESAASRIIIPFLVGAGITPDLLLLSHQDSDHVGGAYHLLSHYPALPWLGAVQPSHALQQLKAAAARCERGQSWSWDGVDFEILHPAPVDYVNTEIYGNEHSCVLRVSNYRSSILLTGDIYMRQEIELLKTFSRQRDKLRADILMVPHHGSKTSSAISFITEVKPRYAVVQAGYLNRFGHPHPSVMAKYQKYGIEVKNTAHCGMAVWSSSNQQQLRCWRQERSKYWHNLLKMNENN